MKPTTRPVGPGLICLIAMLVMAAVVFGVAWLAWLSMGLAQ